MSYKNTPAYRKAMSGLNITAAAAVILSGVAIAPAAQAQESTPSTSTSPQKEKESIKERCETVKKNNYQNDKFDEKTGDIKVYGIMQIFMDELRDTLRKYREGGDSKYPAELLDEYLEKFPDDKEVVKQAISESSLFEASNYHKWTTYVNGMNVPKDYPDIDKISKNLQGVLSCDDIVKNEEKVFDQIYKAAQMEIIVKTIINNADRVSKDSAENPSFSTLALVKDDNGDFSGLKKQNKDGKTTYKGNLTFTGYPIEWVEEERGFKNIDTKEVTKQYEREKWLYEKIFDAQKKYEEATGKKHYAEGAGGISLRYRWEFDNSDFLPTPTFRPTKATLKDAWMIQDDIYHMILDAEKKAQEGTLTQEELDNLDYFLTRMRNTNKASHFEGFYTESSFPQLYDSRIIKIAPPLSYEDWEKANLNEPQYHVDKFNKLSDEQKKEEYEKYKKDHERIIGSKFVEKYADKMEGDAFSPIDIAPQHKRNYDNFAWAWDLTPYMDKEEPKPEPSEEPKPSEDTSTPKTTPNEDGGKKTTPTKTTPTTKPSTPKTTPVEDNDKTSTPEESTPETSSEAPSTTPTQPVDTPTAQAQPEEDVFTPLSKAPQPQRLNSTPGKTAAAVKGPEVNTGGEVESQSFFDKVVNIFR